MNTGSLALFALSALFLLAYFAFERTRRAAERRRRVVREWGRRLDARGEMEEIALYHRLSGPSDDVLDDRTWDDLDLDAVFREVDRTRSSPGQQHLYRRLREQNRSDLPHFERLLSALENDAEARVSMQVTLSRLSGAEAYYLPHILLDELPPVSRWRFLYPVLSLLLVGSIAGAFLHPIFALTFAVAVVANIAIQLRYRATIHFYVRPLRFVHLLIDVARELAANTPDEEVRLRASTAIAGLRTIDRLTSWLNFDDDNSGDLVAIARQYANMLLLVDVIALSFSLGQLRAKQRLLHDVFDLVGELDTAISVVSWRHASEPWCRPEFRDGPLNARDLRHPLIAAPVPNDASFQKSMLITGSNMSGKSTYLRTVGVGVLTAQTLNTVLATSYAAPRLELATSIGRSDSLLEGKSYYLAEVERVGALLERRSRPERQLFILDELFRGTNTTERIAASFAVLKHLDQGRHVTLVATHDLELAPMLGEQYAVAHFREIIEEGTLSFDYRLTDGVSSTRNAIAILELMKFPPDVVADARRAAEA